MAQLAQQLAAVQTERDRLAEQVAVLRALPDAPLAASASFHKTVHDCYGHGVQSHLQPRLCLLCPCFRIHVLLSATT